MLLGAEKRSEPSSQEPEGHVVHFHPSTDRRDRARSRWRPRMFCALSRRTFCVPHRGGSSRREHSHLSGRLTEDVAGRIAEPREPRPAGVGDLVWIGLPGRCCRNLKLLTRRRRISRAGRGARDRDVRHRSRRALGRHRRRQRSMCWLRWRAGSSSERWRGGRWLRRRSW